MTGMLMVQKWAVAPESAMARIGEEMGGDGGWRLDKTGSGWTMIEGSAGVTGNSILVGELQALCCL
jgi:hypothetical protein